MVTGTVCMRVMIARLSHLSKVRQNIGHQSDVGDVGTTTSLWWSLQHSYERASLLQLQQEIAYRELEPLAKHTRFDDV